MIEQKINILVTFILVTLNLSVSNHLILLGLRHQLLPHFHPVSISTCFLQSSWKIACPETWHRFGCFDSHIYIIYLLGFVLLTLLHGATTHSYFVEADDKVTTLQSGYCVCTLNYRDVALSLVSTKCCQWKFIAALSCHFVLFANFEQVWSLQKLFCLLTLNINLLWGGNLSVEITLWCFFGLLIADFEQIFI